MDGYNPVVIVQMHKVQGMRIWGREHSPQNSKGISLQFYKIINLGFICSCQNPFLLICCFLNNKYLCEEKATKKALQRLYADEFKVFIQQGPCLSIM